MSSFQSNQGIQIDLQVILNSLAQLDTPALEVFVEQVSNLLAKRKIASLSQEETQLLLSINKGLPEDTLKRLHDLQEKQHITGVNSNEAKELEELIDKIESQEAARLEQLIALASLWDISLDELREKLGLKTPEPNVW